MEKWLNRPGSYNCIYALPADTLGRDVIACLGHKPQQGRRLALAGPRHAGNSPAPTRNQGTTVIRPLARQPDQGGSQRESDRHLGRAQPPSADGGQVAPSEARQCHVRPASRCDSAIPTAPGIAAATKTCSGWYVSTCPGGRSVALPPAAARSHRRPDPREVAQSTGRTICIGDIPKFCA